MSIWRWQGCSGVVRRRSRAAGSVGEARRGGRAGGRRRVKGDRDAGTAAGLAMRAHRSSAVAACGASRRRGRRSGPLTRLAESTLSGRDRRSSGSIRGRRRFPPPSPRGAHPTAEPCLPARAGVRGPAPGCGTGRGRWPTLHPAAGAMPSAMRRNSARRSAWTRRAASRSVSAAAAASSSSKSTLGLRWRSALSRERNLA